MLDTLGRRPKKGKRYPRFSFRYEECWAREDEAKRVIKDVWDEGHGNVMRGIEFIWNSLGRWQHNRYKDSKGRINSLLKEIDKLIDEPRIEQNIERLPNAKVKLSRLYNSKEIYWAQRSHIRWMKEGGRNTRFFQVRAMHMSKKNFIEGFNDTSNNWITKEKGICDVA